MDVSSGTIDSSTVRKVEFLNVQDQYSHDEDLVCEYALVDHVPQEHDRVSIYRIGWAHVKEYVLFEWAPVCEKGSVQKIVFDRPSLPKETPDIMYHFCYISSENKVLGASPPFQFCGDVTAAQLQSYSSFASLQTVDTKLVIEKDQKIAKLQEENTLLKETLRMIVFERKGSKVQQEVEELKSTVQLLQKAFYLQQNEILDLKKKLQEKESSKNVENMKNLSLINVGELETLPPFPKFL